MPTISSKPHENPNPSHWEIVGRLLSVVQRDADAETVTRGISQALQREIPHDDLRISLNPTIESWWLKPTGFDIERYDPPLSDADEHVSALRWVALNQAPLLRRDLNEDSRFTKDGDVLENGRVSSLYLPLFDGDDYYGVLSLASLRANQFERAWNVPSNTS